MFLRIGLHILNFPIRYDRNFFPFLRQARALFGLLQVPCYFPLSSKGPPSALCAKNNNPTCYQQEEEKN